MKLIFSCYLKISHKTWRRKKNRKRKPKSIVFTRTINTKKQKKDTYSYFETQINRNLINRYRKHEIKERKLNSIVTGHDRKAGFHYQIRSPQENISPLQYIHFRPVRQKSITPKLLVDHHRRALKSNSQKSITISDFSDFSLPAKVHPRLLKIKHIIVNYTRAIVNIHSYPTPILILITQT